MTETAELEAVVEAALFATPEPITRARIVELFPKVDRREVIAAIDRVIHRYAGRDDQGIRAEEVAGGSELRHVGVAAKGGGKVNSDDDKAAVGGHSD